MTTVYVVLFALLALLCVVAFLVVRSRRTEYTASIDRARRRRLGGRVPCGRLGRPGSLLFAASDADAWHDLEDLLVKADVGPKGAADLVARVRARYTEGEDPVGLLREEILAILGPDLMLDLGADGLDVILVVGVNGAGKTTTIGKLAAMLAAEGKQVSLAASDTFRAAAGEQLEVWADRAGAHLVSQDRGADPGAVAFDAVTSATARGPTSSSSTPRDGCTKQPLMDELGRSSA